MKLISEFKKDDLICEQLLVSNVTKSTTSTNTPYLSIDFKDKSGVINGRKWDYLIEDEDLFQVGNILLVSGEVMVFRDRLQIKINEARKLESEEIEISKFQKEAPRDYLTLNSMYDYYLHSISDEKLQAVVKEAVSQYEYRYFNHPAGRNIHHDYPHGLLTHILSMCELADFFAHHYEDVDYDLLIAATLLHDIGKTIELEGEIEYTYTLEGRLLGHIPIGETIVKEACEKVGLNQEKSTLLQHCILSHHGQLDYGSPVIPLIKEAMILSIIDTADSKLAVLAKALEVTKEGEFTQRIYALDNNQFYKPKK